MIKNYLTYIKENKGSINFVKIGDDILDSDTIKKSIGPNNSILDVVIYLNKEWLGFLKISPEYNEYYIHVTGWNLKKNDDDLLGFDIFYDKYYIKNEFRFIEHINANLSVYNFRITKYKKRDPLIKIDPILDPYSEEDWHEEENENIKLNENNELYDFLLGKIIEKIKEKKIINFKDIIEGNGYYYLFKEKSPIPRIKDIMSGTSSFILESPVVNYRTIDGKEYTEKVKEINIYKGVGTTFSPSINREGYVIFFNRKEIDINRNVKIGIFPKHLKEIDPYEEDNW